MKRRWCRHYTGFLGPGVVHIEECKAGVNYWQKTGKQRSGEVSKLLPCVGEGPASGCDLYSPYTKAEEEESERKATTAILRLFDDRLCPSCDRKYQGKQVGPCVYCEHCGTRLYQGTVPK